MNTVFFALFVVYVHFGANGALDGVNVSAGSLWDSQAQCEQAKPLALSYAQGSTAGKNNGRRVWNAYCTTPTR
jgi:hypothetical protein